MGPKRPLERQGAIYYSFFHTCLPDENAPQVHWIIHSHFLSWPLSWKEYLTDFISVAHVTLLCRAAIPPARIPLKDFSHGVKDLRICGWESSNSDVIMAT